MSLWEKLFNTTIAKPEDFVTYNDLLKYYKKHKPENAEKHATTFLSDYILNKVQKHLKQRNIKLDKPLNMTWSLPDGQEERELKEDLSYYIDNALDAYDNRAIPGLGIQREVLFGQDGYPFAVRDEAGKVYTTNNIKASDIDPIKDVGIRLHVKPTAKQAKILSKLLSKD